MLYENSRLTKIAVLLITVSALMLLGACASTYYNAMEKVGVHKRDILVDRVENARDAQSDAQEQFKSALEQFRSVVNVEPSDLSEAYERLNAEYEASENAAEKVSDRIDSIESVADALFTEWEEELELYKRADLKAKSRKQMLATKSQYNKMLASMHRAEKSMAPVLSSFQDNVLFLKHNLNAQAISSLRSEFSSMKGEIDSLIKNMNEAIESSNRFIADIKTN
ncbi:MAG: DUF2959 domain-containing protein [Desulfatibacillum sp.]|nr:DUF2959 domain-containing protein [Desulfatibacillum sp.]